MRSKYLSARSFLLPVPKPFQPFCTKLLATAPVSDRHKNVRLGSMMLLACSLAPIARAKDLGLRPENPSLQDRRARKKIRDTWAMSIQPPLKEHATAANADFYPSIGPSQNCLRQWLAACDGMNHQNFVLFAAHFLDAFAGGHVEWLGARLGFIFGNHPVDFIHIGRRPI